MFDQATLDQAIRLYLTPPSLDQEIRLCLTPPSLVQIDQVISVAAPSGHELPR